MSQYWCVSLSQPSDFYMLVYTIAHNQEDMMWSEIGYDGELYKNNPLRIADNNLAKTRAQSATSK